MASISELRSFGYKAGAMKPKIMDGLLAARAILVILLPQELGLVRASQISGLVDSVALIS